MGKIINKCLNCSIEFVGSNVYRKYKFCSQKCNGEYKLKNNTNYKIVNCTQCGVQIGRRKIKENNVYLCSPSCQLKYEYANNLRDLKGIHTTHKIMREKAQEKINKGVKYFNRSMSTDGYWRIYVPLQGWKKEHIYLIEQKYGKIPEGYEIHHKDGDKLNNNIDNLELLPKKLHKQLHCNERERDKLGKFT